MTSNIKKHLGTIIAALAAIGSELLNCEPGDAPETQPTEPKKSPGRPKKEPAPPEAPAETPKENPAPGGGGKTYEELKEVCAPLIKEQKTARVKEILKEHGGTTLRDIPVANQPAFIKAIEAEIEAGAI